MAAAFDFAGSWLPLLFVSVDGQDGLELIATRESLPENVTYIRCVVRSCSNRTFEVKAQGDSMDANGGYRPGDVIVVDPDKPAAHGRDVIVEPAERRLARRRPSIHEDVTRYFGAPSLNPADPAPYLKQ